MKHKFAGSIIIFLFLCAGSLLAQDNEKLLYATESGLGIQFGGEVEMEFVDIEGPGGFSNQDLTKQKVKNRSPHMRIDKAILSTKIFYSENLTYELEFRMGDDGTRIDKHYARLKLPSLFTRIELGKNRPFVYADRHTEGYPLIGTAFWKGREYHLTSETKYDINEDIMLITGLSFAMKRPIETDDAAEDKSFKMLVYGDYSNHDGQTFEYGVKLGLQAYGFSALGWYYTGDLIDDFDWKIQLSQTLSEYDNLGDRTDITHYWYGGRLGFDKYNIHLVGEFIKSQDGLLPRQGYYVQGAYRYGIASENFPIEALEPFFRYGVLDVLDHVPQLGNSLTWDRKMTTLALLIHLNKNLLIKTEYYLLDEVTGGAPPEDSVKDNQFLLQINFKF